jgi:hypothetical protein
MKSRVMTIIPAGPPEMKRVNKSVKGNMAKSIFDIQLSVSEFLGAKLSTNEPDLQSRIPSTCCRIPENKLTGAVG